MDETGPGTREEAYHARQSGTNASSRWTANASKNPDGLIQCTFPRLSSLSVVPLAPGRRTRVVLSAVENALLQDLPHIRY